MKNLVNEMNKHISTIFIILSFFLNGEGGSKHEKLIKDFCSNVLFNMDGKRKGDAGKIGVFGGSTVFTGAPYFAAMASLKAGADIVYVFTSDTASEIIKSYSPDLIVYPLSVEFLPHIESLLDEMDLIIIGSGLGRENMSMVLINNIIQYCKSTKTPLVIDGDGIYAISKHPSVLDSYPSPGVILTPNFNEAELLKNLFHWPTLIENWPTLGWGTHVSVLLKGQSDDYIAADPMYNWNLPTGGSSRRVAGQGDILAGIVGTFFNWAIIANANNRKDDIQLHYFKSMAAYAAAKLTRSCNAKAFAKQGRSMLAFDMLNKMNVALKELC